MGATGQPAQEGGTARLRGSVDGQAGDAVLNVVATFGDLARVNSPDVAERLDQWTERTDLATGEGGSAAEALANRIVAYVMARTVPAN